MIDKSCFHRSVSHHLFVSTVIQYKYLHTHPSKIAPQVAMKWLVFLEKVQLCGWNIHNWMLVNLQRRSQVAHTLHIINFFLLHICVISQHIEICGLDGMLPEFEKIQLQRRSEGHTLAREPHNVF
eukprot:TRINITY_DN26269_c0_g1_i1.p1 TRINITY_DN26269_c0_g1~~TRINITY_DN26269_c0_g1_i1.p1  ORF type:complete len:125 (+),score=1.59 TRINITY_DN26269_c0_g1_i1:62-436(+)